MAYTAKVGDINIPVGKDNEQQVIDIGQGRYHIIQDNVCHIGELISQNDKNIVVKINGHKYNVAIQDDIDNMVASMGLDVVATPKASSLKAPMPGLILDILVCAGDEVTNGTQLLILEAMKMENMITSVGDGVVKSVEIKKGDIVEKNQLLIELE